MEYAAYMAATLIGLSLGLIGAGGSILTVPVLVYLAHVDPVLATAYSLFVVGSTALVGGIQNHIKKLVDLRTALIFGVPSIVAVYATRAFIMPNIPDAIAIDGLFSVSKGVGILVVFAILMIATSVSMIRGNGKPKPAETTKKEHHFGLVFAEGIGVGVLTGLVGAGGGFLIIPALVLLAGLEMKVAVGTSLLIIAMKSLIGFTGDIQSGMPIDWPFLLTFTSFSVAGIFVGSWLNKFFDGQKLKQGFGWFVLAMGLYMIARETIFG